MNARQPEWPRDPRSENHKNERSSGHHEHPGLCLEVLSVCNRIHLFACLKGVVNGAHASASYANKYASAVCHVCTWPKKGVAPPRVERCILFMRYKHEVGPAGSIASGAMGCGVERLSHGCGERQVIIGGERPNGCGVRRRSISRHIASHDPSLLELPHANPGEKTLLN
jgi:hypothetical protein